MTLILEDRALATSSDREAWLRARRAGVTATEIAKIDRGGAAVETLLEEKRTGISSFNGNRYTEWGKEREPFIAAWVLERFDISPSDILYHAVENVQHLATPDGAGLDFDGNVMLSEIKTSKHDLSTVPRDYLVQIWWQQYVLGARCTLFAWEQHNDDWPEPQPLGEPRFQWIERNDKEIASLVAKANLFLERLAGEVTAEPEYSLQLDELAQEYLIHLGGESTEKKAKETVWKQLQEELAEKGTFSQASSTARITRSVTTTSVEQPDEDAARAADPETAAAYDLAVANYSALLAQHTKTSERTTTTLKVTPIKKAA